MGRSALFGGGGGVIVGGFGLVLRGVAVVLFFVAAACNDETPHGHCRFERGILFSAFMISVNGRG